MCCTAGCSKISEPALAKIGIDRSVTGTRYLAPPASRAPFQKSYELGRGSADILSRYATFRSNLRDHDRAERVIAQAARLDPLSARMFFGVFSMLYRLRARVDQRAIGKEEARAAGEEVTE